MTAQQARQRLDYGRASRSICIRFGADEKEKSAWNSETVWLRDLWHMARPSPAWLARVLRGANESPAITAFGIT